MHFINTALDHTCTLIELFVVKARIYKVGYLTTLLFFIYDLNGVKLNDIRMNLLGMSSESICFLCENRSEINLLTLFLLDNSTIIQK